MLALAMHDNRGFADLALAMCKAPAHVDRDAFAADLDLWLSKNMYVGMGEGDVTATVNEGSAVLKKYDLRLPPDMALVFRVLVRLQGLAQSMGVTATIDQALQPYVGEMVQRRLDPRRIAGDVTRTLRSWHNLARELPDDLRSVFDQLSRGEVAVDLRLHDPDQAVDRLVDGLIASGSLLAGALLWSRRTGPTIGGISAPGLLATLAGAGTWLKLLSDRREQRPVLPTALHTATNLAKLRRPD